MHPSTSNITFTWGKYKGYTFQHVLHNNPSYLEWMRDTESVPSQWREAASLALEGKDVSHLPIAKTVSPQKKKADTKTTPIRVFRVSDKTAGLDMPYDPALVAKFKYEVDGRTWDKKKRQWQFPYTQLNKAINAFADQHLVLDDFSSKMREKLIERREKLDELRVLDDTDIDIPGLKKELYPYQRTGIRFVETAGGRALIADQPGLGKTAQAIGYAQYKDLKTLIVCPLSVVIGWQRQIKMFTGKDATVWTGDGREGKPSNQFHICHYDAVRKVIGNLQKMEFDFLVCDEATNLRNRNTLRAKSLLGSYKERRKYPGLKTKHVLFLTGTPVTSRPIEAYHLLSFLDKQRFNNFYHFVERYGGWRGEPARNLQDLHDRTKDVVIRRHKSLVQKELPPKQRNDLYVELTKAERAEYQNLLTNLFGRWMVEKPSVANMHPIQTFLIEKKLPRLFELIDEYLDNDRPLLIFSNYTDPLHRIAERYGDKAAILDGSMKKNERQNSIDRLVRGTAKVGCFSLLAAGMGIDELQHSIDTVVFLNMDWLPANHEQAEDRTHRIGQRSQVQVYYMICDGTIDEYMRDILREKQIIADMVVDGDVITPQNNKSFFKEFVRKIGTIGGVEIDVEKVED